MNATTTPKPNPAAWLSGYLDKAASKNLCVRIGCTTCGAVEFRNGLYVNAAAAIGEGTASQLPGHGQQVREYVATVQEDVRIRLELARQLSMLDPSPQQENKWLDAVRMIFFELWRTVGDAAAERDYQHVVEGTWAGSVLSAMQAHDRRREEERQAHDRFNSPEAIQARREAKLQQKRKAYRERLVRKQERDRLWFEHHPRPTKPDPKDHSG